MQGNAAVCNGVDSIAATECRIAGGDGTLWANMPAASRDMLRATYECTALGLWCLDSENVAACQDYEVRYMCQSKCDTCVKVSAIRVSK